MYLPSAVFVFAFSLWLIAFSCICLSTVFVFAFSLGLIAYSCICICFQLFLQIPIHLLQARFNILRQIHLLCYLLKEGAIAGNGEGIEFYRH